MAFPSQSLQHVQKQSQQLILAPQLRHSLKILQVPTVDLRATIQEELQSNPLLEELPMDTPNIETNGIRSDKENSADNGSESDDNHDNHDNHDQIDRDLEILNQLDDDWRDLHAQTRNTYEYSSDALKRRQHFFDSLVSETSTDHDNPDQLHRELQLLNHLDDDWRHLHAQTRNTYEYSSDALKRRQHFFDSLVSETSLQEHLMRQASLADCTPEQRTALEYLIGNLDNRGFLASSLDEIRMFSELPRETFEEAWEILKTFDPPGIGASDLKDCLLQQLKQNGKGKSIAASIIRDHFDALLRRRIPEIARKLGHSIEEIENAIDEIAALDPAPGRRCGEDTNRTISPDVTVEKIGDEWTVTLNNEYTPRHRISNTYKDMIASGRLTRKDKEHIHEKMRSGRFLISSIELRQQTIEKITRDRKSTRLNSSHVAIS